MFKRARLLWHKFRSTPAGRRFRQHYDHRAAERAKGVARWSRPLRVGGACLSLLIAIPLMVLPGPAVVFYLIAGFLLAGESIWTASLLDRTEVTLRRLITRWRRRRHRFRRSR